METKNNKNSPLTKALVATALVLAAALIAVTLLSLPSLLGGTPAATEQPTEAPTLPPTEPEPTLPPPEENPFGSLDFQYEGRYLKLREGNSVTGIDVSHWQKLIDWEQVKESGVDFAMIRLGYRGYTEGGLFLDPWYEKNITGAAAAGLDTGVYFFSQAVNVGEAIEEAEFVIDNLKGYRVNLPIIFDWEQIEDEARTDDVGVQTRTDCAVAFCRTITNAGYDAGVYFNRKLGYYGFDLSRLADYAIWVSVPGDFPDFYYACDFWQFSFEGTVPGIEGNADLNLRFIPVSEQKKN